MSDQSRLVISARLDNVRQACDFVVEAAESAGLDERAIYHCQMAVDESLTNIIEHGYQFKGDDHQIEIACTTRDRAFEIVIIDDSPAFNPLEHQAPDPTSPLDSREPGGWGIYFIRRLMDDVRYRHANARNFLTLVKALPEPPSPSEDETTPADHFPVRQIADHRVVVTPSGRLDSASTPRLEVTLARQLDQGNIWLVVDLHAVEYIASGGLKVLVSAWRRAQDRGGGLILSGLQPRLVEIFEMVGFDMLFQVYPDLDAALASWG